MCLRLRKKDSTSIQLEWVVFFISIWEQMLKLLVHTFKQVMTKLVPGSPKTVLCLVICYHYLLLREVNILRDESVSGQLNMSNLMSLYVSLCGPITCLHFILFCLCNYVVFVYMCVRAGCIIAPMRLKMQVNKIKPI